MREHERHSGREGGGGRQRGFRREKVNFVEVACHEAENGSIFDVC